jgi:exopolysaccharide biosynthesis polyprenyl glycosylphosphotransferase
MYGKENSGWVKHIDFVILDILCLQGAFLISFWFRQHGFYNPYRQELYSNMAIILALIQLLVIFFGETFSGVLRRGNLVEFKSSLYQATWIILLANLYLFLIKEGGSFSRIMLVLTWAIYIVLTMCVRKILKIYLNDKKYSESGARSMLIVTDEKSVSDVVNSIRSSNYGSYHLAGVVLMDSDRTGEMIEGLPVVADEQGLVSYIHKNWVDEVFFALPREDDIPEKVLKDCTSMGVVIHIRLASKRTLGKNQIVEEMSGCTVLSSSIRIVTPKQLFFKRMMDIAGGIVGCFFTAILFVILAPLIKIASPGPVLFSQTRVGKSGRPFRIYKFRSMYMDAEERKKELMEQNNIKDGLMFKMDDDPRVIRGIGHFIRKTSLDEFPQFWNVLKGDMSLVGTRPPTVDEWEKYELHHRRRLAIKPGLTGMWQISGRSDIVDFEEVVELDTKYISDWSLKLDIQILLKTVMIVFTGSGAK